MAVLVISYSRIDQPIVRGLVTLLRTALKGLDRTVFWDSDFEAGDAWFQQMCNGIDDSDQLFVLWCVHSASSLQVAREIEYAQSHGKRVIPLLVDETPLSPALTSIHAVDLRASFVHIDDERLAVTSHPEVRYLSHLSLPARAIRGEARIIHGLGEAYVRLVNRFVQILLDTSRNPPFG
jgi:hypothetical protein